MDKKIYQEMEEKKKVIYSVLETQALGLKVAKNNGYNSSILMHLDNLKEFVGKAKEAGLDNKIITKYKTIIERNTN